MEKWVLEVGRRKGFFGSRRRPSPPRRFPGSLSPPVFPVAPSLTPSAPYSQAGEEGP